MNINIKYPQSKCKYCGQTFTKTHNRQEYCTKECRDNARQEKRRTYNLRYYNKNKNRIHHKYPGTNTLAPHRNPDPQRETEIIQNEKRRIGIQ